VLTSHSLQSYLIRTRNDMVRTQLQEAYSDRVPGNNPPVFCVSNFLYWHHRSGPRDISRPFLDLSGILEVRRHCISIVAESQLAAATEFMRKRIPALLEPLQLWVQSGAGTLSAERKVAIRAALDEVERKLRKVRAQYGVLTLC
jgi:hypothetical protein